MTSQQPLEIARLTPENLSLAKHRHVLVLPCSGAKSAARDAMPAWRRYRGPLHLQLAKRPPESTSVYFLSAFYGLIRAGAGIVDYDEKFTGESAAVMRAECATWRRDVFTRQLAGEISESNFAGSFIGEPGPAGAVTGERLAIMGEAYAEVFRAHLAEPERWTIFTGSILQQRAALTRFLDSHQSATGKEN